MNTEKRFLTREQAAEFLGLKAQTLANMTWRGEGPPNIRISSRCIRYDLDELVAWAKSLEIRPT